ncbi:MAG: helix-turn-helix domain-containing protein [Pseudomonadota bacterium]
MKKSYNNEFKFKVILEVLRGDSTIAEIISKYQISKTIIHRWKNQFFANGANIFGSKKSDDAKEEPSIDKLHATIGKLKVENDFLAEAWKKIKN